MARRARRSNLAAICVIFRIDEAAIGVVIPMAWRRWVYIEKQALTYSSSFGERVEKYDMLGCLLLIIMFVDFPFYVVVIKILTQF